MDIMIGVMQGRLSPSAELMFFPFDTWEEEFAAAARIGDGALERLGGGTQVAGAVIDDDDAHGPELMS